MNSARNRPDAVDRQGGHLLGVLGEGQVDVDLRGERTRAAGPAGCGARPRTDAATAGGHGALGHRALGAVDGDELAVAQHGRGVAGADDGGDAQLARDDGGVAGHAAAVGHDGGGPAHGGHPVGARHGRHQDLTGLQAVALVGRLQHPHHARGPARRGRQALHQQRAPLGRRCGRGSPPTAVTGPRLHEVGAGRRPWPTPCPAASRSGPRRPGRCVPPRRPRRR